MKGHRTSGWTTPRQKSATALSYWDGVTATEKADEKGGEKSESELVTKILSKKDDICSFLRLPHTTRARTETARVCERRVHFWGLHEATRLARSPRCVLSGLEHARCEDTVERRRLTRDTGKEERERITLFCFFRAERRNRIVIDSARTSLVESLFPRKAKGHSASPCSGVGKQAKQLTATLLFRGAECAPRDRAAKVI